MVSAPVPAAAPAPAAASALRRDAPAIEDGAAAKPQRDMARSRAAGPAGAAEPFTLLTPTQEAQLGPERWITYLIELRQRGQHDAADASLLRLRARYPDQTIPPGAASRQPR